MPTPVLTLDDLAAIASAPAELGDAELARRLGRPYTAVQSARSKMRHAGGWYCRLLLTPCSECGLPVAGPRNQTAHPDCRRRIRNRPRRAQAARLARETAAAATNHGASWSDRERAYLLDHPGATAREPALALGRTGVAVGHERLALRKGRPPRRPYRPKPKPPPPPSIPKPLDVPPALGMRLGLAPAGPQGSGRTSSGPSLPDRLTAVETGHASIRSSG